MYVKWMNLLLIEKGTWEFYAVCDDRGRCEILRFFAELDKRHAAAHDNLLALIRRVSHDPQGPACLPDSKSHYIDKREKIYEFIAGKIRLVWFYSPFERRVIVCSHAFIKKSGKTPPTVKNNAISIKKKYEAAYRSRNIRILIKENNEL